MFEKWLTPKREKPFKAKRKARLKKRISLMAVLIYGLLAVIGFGLVGMIMLSFAISTMQHRIPDYKEMKSAPKAQTVILRGASDQIIANVGPVYGDWLYDAQIPPIMKDAIVAIEDRRYYRHTGVDLRGIARAFWINYKSGKRLQGGSTITQQAVKNVFLSSERSVRRKLKEMLIALAMERKFTKEQILEIYLNRVYFGGGAFGIDAASRRFFGHSATSLTLPEAAIIAGLVRAPSRFAPSASTKLSVRRAKIVLNSMVANSYVTSEKAEKVSWESISFAKPPTEKSVRYFVDWILRQIDRYVENSKDALEVYTTLDATMQEQAETALNNNLPDETQGAVVALDSDGAVRTMLGGKNYVNSTFNRALFAFRQPGSAFKLFVYLSALEAGLTPFDRAVDQPVNIDGWEPVNHNHKYVGEVSLMYAFAHSINTISAQLVQHVGENTVASMARRLGVSSQVLPVPSMALGTSEMNLLDLTTAYAVVANGGYLVKPYGIREIRLVDGKTLYKREDLPEDRVLEPAVASDMVAMLKATVATGTGYAATQLRRPAAGKTGTTQSSRDGWFVGFSSGLTSGVWIGRDDDRPVSGLSGARAPAKTWLDFMIEATVLREAVPLFRSAKGRGVPPLDSVLTIGGIASDQFIDEDYSSQEYPQYMKKSPPAMLPYNNPVDDRSNVPRSPATDPAQYRPERNEPINLLPQSSRTKRKRNAGTGQPLRWQDGDGFKDIERAVDRMEDKKSNR